MVERKLIRITSDADKVYLEEDNQSGIFVPISLDNAKTVYQIFADLFQRKDFTINFRDMIPDKVIQYRLGENLNSTSIIWFVKPRKKFLMHSRKELQGIVYYPPALLKYVNKTLYVYAVKEKSRAELSRDTELYKFPFPNMFNNDNLCFGSIRSNKNVDYLDTLIEEMEDSLYNTKYTHGLNTAPMKAKNPEDYFKAMDNGDLKEFPLDVLLKTKLTIKDIL